MSSAGCPHPRVATFLVGGESVGSRCGRSRLTRTAPSDQREVLPSDDILSHSKAFQKQMLSNCVNLGFSSSKPHLGVSKHSSGHMVLKHFHQPLWKRRHEAHQALHVAGQRRGCSWPQRHGGWLWHTKYCVKMGFSSLVTEAVFLNCYFV